MYMYSASWLLKSWFQISKFHFLVSIQLSCDLKNHADLGGCYSREASEFIISSCAIKWASTAVSRGVHVVLAACTLFRPSTYICLFKYTILYWSFPVGICIQCDVTQYNCNYYNRAVFTWLSKGIGFGFGFGFTTPFDWLVYLLWFWFYDSQVKTALLLYIAGDGTS